MRLLETSNQNIVYVKKIESASNSPISNTLYRYDVTTHQTTQILQIENADIANAQVSANGQWVIFLSEVGGSPAIQMVRMDGQGLQTLYCMPTTQYSYQRTILDSLVSPDQKQLAFVTGLDQDQATFSLLNMTNGTVQAALQAHPGFTLYQPVMWLNDTQLYLWRYPVMQSALFLLNTQNGPDQPSNVLTDVADFPSLESFDVSPDRTKLFIGLCQVCGQGIFVGPSSISVQPATGTVRHIIYDPKGAILALLAAPNNTLLFGISNYSQTPSVPADTSQNGIWKINVDGSDLSRLSSGGLCWRMKQSMESGLFEPQNHQV